MNCLEFRRQVATEPARHSATLDVHASGCRACAEFAAETRKMDALMLRALTVPLPASVQNYSVADDKSPTVFGQSPAGARWPGRESAGWLAVAASVLIAALLSVGLWRGAAPETLGGELVAHVRHEPMSLLPVAEPVAADEVELVLRRTGARVSASLGTVTYLETCPFRNRQVAHIVIEGSTGPVTLLLLPHVSVEEETKFEEGGLKGTIVPVGNGSVAVIGSETEPLEAVGKLVSSAVAWRI